MIPVSKPFIGSAEIRAVAGVLKSGFIVQGPKVKEFEEKFSAYSQAKYGIAASNGTLAGITALHSVGVKPGDEVITTPFTFIATANAILALGAKPVFVDIGSDYNIDADKIAEKITPKTKAILPVHLYGFPCNMKKIMEVASSHNLKVVEDCAQAHGAMIEDKKVGSFGDASFFSFYATKNMTTSEGGMVLTSDDGVLEKARLYVNHGSPKKYLHVEFGLNYRMTDIAAAIGLVQLEKLEKFTRKRISNAKLFSKSLSSINEVKLPSVKRKTRHVYHQYTLRVPKEKRDALMVFLNSKQIGCAIHYPIALHKQPFYQSLGYTDSLPNAELASQEVLSIPVHQGLSVEEKQLIIQSIKEFFA